MNTQTLVVIVGIVILITIVKLLPAIKQAVANRRRNASATTINVRSQNRSNLFLTIWPWIQTPLYQNWKKIVGLVVIHFILWFFFHDVWLYRAIAGSWLFWFVQITIVVTYLVFRDGGQYGQKSKLSGWGLAIILVTLIGSAYSVYNQVTETSKEGFDDLAQHLSTPTREFLNPKPFLPRNREMEKKVRQFWLEHLPRRDALEMIEITRLESNFNQTEKDGSPYRGRLNWHVVGLTQIDELAWKKEIEETKLNIYDKEGDENLQMALYIHQNHGGSKWWATKRQLEKGLLPSPAKAEMEAYINRWSLSRHDFVAKPGEEFGEIIPTPGPYWVDAKGPVEIRFSDNHTTETDIGRTGEMRRTTTVALRALVPVPVEVTVWK